MRKTKFQTGEYYHIYNRGVDKREIFMEEKDYLRFLRGMREFNVPEPIGSLYAKEKRENGGGGTGRSSGTGGSGTGRCPAPSASAEGAGHLPVPLPDPHLVEIICYCLNPNHYHFILKQLAEGGVSEFMKRLGGGYTNYFNQKYDRSGSLFQGNFKEVHIKINEQLFYVSGYVNGNAEIHKIAKAEDWRWSSYRDYLGLRNGTLCDKEIILSQFKSVEEYKEYVDLVIEKSGERKDLEKYFIE